MRKIGAALFFGWAEHRLSGPWKSTYDRGPGRTFTTLTAVFERLAERGVLRVDDPRLAAQQFNWMIVADPLNRAMLLGRDRPPTRAELTRRADAGVEVFLAAYGAR